MNLEARGGMSKARLYLLLVIFLSGCGNSASTEPTPPVAAIPEPKLGTWKQLEPVPSEIMDNTASVVLNNDSLYVSQGGGWRGYWLYSKSSNSWHSTAPIPDDKARPYSNLIWLGGDYLYTFDVWGSQGACIWQYAISQDTWSKLSLYPSVRPVYSGTHAIGKIVNNKKMIYVLSSSSDFWAYSISDNTWNKIDTTPRFPSVMMPNNDDFIYGIEIGGNTLWKYSISNKICTLLKNAPVVFEDYGARPVTINGNDIFVLRGEIYDYTNQIWSPTNDLFRYSVSRNEWISLDPLPGYAGASSTMTSANDGLYLIVGGPTSSLYYLPISY
jgi:hypothetical protein